MLRKTSLRVLTLFLLPAAFAVSYLAAQDSPDATSVAEAARRARQQKQAAAKPSQVVTNDSLPPSPTTANNGAVSGAAPSSGSTAAASSDSDSAEDASTKNSEIAALKQEIKQKEESVNLLKRQLALDQDAFYSKADYQRDTAGKLKLDDEQANVAKAQSELDALNGKLTSLAGVDAPKEPAPTTTPASSSEQPQAKP
jgi:hypothetical protein